MKHRRLEESRVGSGEISFADFLQPVLSIVLFIGAEKKPDRYRAFFEKWHRLLFVREKLRGNICHRTEIFENFNSIAIKGR